MQAQGSLNQEVSTCECTDTLVGQTALKTELLLTQGGQPWVGGGSGHVGFFKRSQSPWGSRFMLHRPGPLGAWVLPGKCPSLWRHQLVVLGIHWHFQVSMGLDSHAWLYKSLCLTPDENIHTKASIIWNDQGNLYSWVIMSPLLYRKKRTWGKILLTCF